MRHSPYGIEASSARGLEGTRQQQVAWHDPSYCIIKHLLHQMKYDCVLAIKNTFTHSFSLVVSVIRVRVRVR